MSTNQPTSHTPSMPIHRDTRSFRRLQLSWLPVVMHDTRVRVAAVALLSAVVGLLVALVIPRGPDTSVQALNLMGTGLAVGVLAGLTMRSRWAMLLAPVVFVGAFGVGRRGTDGPLVDGIRLDSTYGILAFILGRGFLALVCLVPMVVGVAYGVSIARRRSSSLPAPRRRLGFVARRLGGGLSTAGVISLAVLIAWPASVPPLRAADGQAIPGSVAELTEVSIGGHEQWIEVRGASADKPVLLWLAGGPGQSDLAYTRVLFDGLAQDVIIINWDQRGTGKSHPALDPTATWTLDQAVSDTIELTNYLRDRFGEQKIYLAGESWGMTLGVLAVQQHPELYFAWIGSGQMVSERETDRQTYAALMQFAQTTGDSSLTDHLVEIGEPPYADVFSYTLLFEHYVDLTPEYTPPAAYQELGNSSGIGPFGVLGSEYTLVDKVNVLAGLLDMFSVMYPQLQEIDFRQDVPRLDVPVYLLQGQYEMASRDGLAREWFGLLQAPHKELFTIGNAGHSAAFEGFTDFQRIMTEVVLPATYTTG